MQKTKVFRLTKKLLAYNFRTLLIFEVFYKLFAFGIFTPLINWTIECSIHLAGLHYLSAATLQKWILTPYTWLLLLLFLLCLACYTLIDMTAVILCIDASKRQEYISVITVIWESCKSVIRMLDIRNLALVPYLVAMLPIVSLSFLSGYITSIQLPAFIESSVTSLLKNYWILIIALLLIIVCLFRFVFSIYYYVLEKKRFSEACKRSNYLIYKAYFPTLLKLFLWQLICYFLFAVFIAVVILLVIGIASLFQQVNFIHAIMIQIIQNLMTATTVLFSCVAVPLSTICLSIMFYQNQELIGEEAPGRHYAARTIALSRKKKRIVMLVVVLALVVVNISNIRSVARGAFSDNTELAHQTDVTAHRGYSSTFPENTMPAFEAAIDCGADWIELDVQQTKDGQIIVMHDSNLKRTTGVNKNIWEVTWDEIRDLDAGSYKAPEFSDVRLSTLEEVLQEVKGKIRVNIELKPTGHETDFAKSVVDIIHENHCEKEVVVASMSYGAISQIKEYDAEIETVFVMKSAYGYFADLEMADAFSIKNTFITEGIVQGVHLQGKQVYAWTINTKAAMEKMLNLGVDNLITDNPITAQQKIFEMESSNLLNRYIDMLMELFRQN